MTATQPHIQSALVCDRVSSSLPEGQKNCAAAGIQLFQVFSSTSALLGLSRSCDYAAVNANLNTLVNFRRSQGMTSQSNMWGEIKGTGLAGSGTGAAGHGGGAGENVALVPEHVLERAEEDAKANSGEFPPEFYQRKPAVGDLAVAFREMVAPLSVAPKAAGGEAASGPAAAAAAGFLPVKGLTVSLKTKDASDKVLVFASLPTSISENHGGTSWVLQRGQYTLGPLHSTWTNDMGRLDNVVMPWVDEPGKARLELNYSVGCRSRGAPELSAQRERRQLTAITLPGAQVTISSDIDPVAVTSSRWNDINGLEQIAHVGKGEKVLVVCTFKYEALWSDELTRGRFSILRNGDPLDRESYGLQSVRATQSGLKRTAVIAMIDDPHPGPMLYTTKGIVTTESEEPRICHIDGERQLALIRLPAAAVSGPHRCEGSTLLDEDRWTAISGLQVTATLRSSSEKVLLVYNTNLNPAELEYEVYFTVFRSSQSGSQNLGQDRQGMWSVASAAVSSTEYPVAMFTDSPGVGTFTYAVHARTRRCGSAREANPIEVGPDGQISAVRLGASSASLRSSTPDTDAVEEGPPTGESKSATTTTLLDAMAAELDLASTNNTLH
mmetsp:Transcript_47171/g.100946  ORF Transcript_47171/g.100946 Transcript_47171/m.100946 type:complete len:610 (+) Transcript_47171:80-1909(+)